MSRLSSILMFTMLVLCGCSHDTAMLPPDTGPQAVVNLKPAKKQKPEPKPNPAEKPVRKNEKPKKNELIVTPETALIGKIISVNANARFVVLNFPLGKMPSLQSRLNVYRRGLKVGEVKVTGPQRDDSTVADILTGDALPSDEVRED